MNVISALSPLVRAYLASIRGAHSQLARFLNSPDFMSIRDFAKDIGGLEVKLGKGKFTLLLNVFGVLSFCPNGRDFYAVSTQAIGEDDEAYERRVHTFPAGMREWLFPGKDSYWCAELVIQSCYDSMTAKVESITSAQK